MENLLFLQIIVWASCRICLLVRRSCGACTFGADFADYLCTKSVFVQWSLFPRRRWNAGNTSRYHCAFWLSMSASSLCIRAPRGEYEYSWGSSRKSIEVQVKYWFLEYKHACCSFALWVGVKSNDNSESGSSDECDACLETCWSMFENAVLF